MVIRRIREHVSTHNWFAVAIDLAIVVIGVFLGTQANNWNEARLERAAAAEYRSQIIEDLKDNESDLASRKAYYETVRAHALAALSAIESRSSPRGEQFVIDAYQASQVWLRPLLRTGYDEMIGAGLTHGIGDRETRSRLTTYYTQTKQFDATALASTAYRERLRRALPYKVQQAIRESCGERVIDLPNGAQTAAFPEHCAPHLDQASIAASVARIEAADLGKDLTRQVADLDQKLAGFDRFWRLAHQHRMFLEAHGGT
jgi:hypothetical protein